MGNAERQTDDFDVYDGHREYLNEARRPFGARFVDTCLAWSGVLAAIVCGRWAWTAAPADASGIQLFKLFAAIGALVACLVFFSALSVQLKSVSDRKKVIGTSCLIFILGFVIPVILNVHQAPVREAAERSEQLRRVADQDQRKKQWRTTMRRSEFHGKVGEAPPMLQIDEVNGGSGVRITNVTGASLHCLTIRWLVMDGDAIDAEATKRCSNGGVERATLAPHQTEIFLVGRKLDAECDDALPSFRLGGHDDFAACPGPTWWSDVELAEFDMLHPEWSEHD